MTYANEVAFRRGLKVQVKGVHASVDCYDCHHDPQNRRMFQGCKQLRDATGGLALEGACGNCVAADSFKACTLRGAHLQALVNQLQLGTTDQATPTCEVADVETQTPQVLTEATSPSWSSGSSSPILLSGTLSW